MKDRPPPVVVDGMDLALRQYWMRQACYRSVLRFASSEVLLQNHLYLVDPFWGGQYVNVVVGTPSLFAGGC